MLQKFIKYQLPKAEKANRISKGIICYVEEGKTFIIAYKDEIITEKVKENFLTNINYKENEISFFSLFETREDFQTQSDGIAWGSYVWFATEPTHKIHFDDKPQLEIRK